MHPLYHEIERLFGLTKKLITLILLMLAKKLCKKLKYMGLEIKFVFTFVLTFLRFYLTFEGAYLAIVMT